MNSPSSSVCIGAPSVATSLLPNPRTSIQIRPGTVADLDFIDDLQKRHSKQLGFMNRPTLEGKVAAGHVLIAETLNDERWTLNEEKASAASSQFSVQRSAISVPLGYLIASDRYRHRDELGVIYQMCVAPEARRSLVAAHLLVAQFGRSAYGCRLYCCWCAQDLVASNRFWEAMGFVPLAFRAGSAKRKRVHIFWQKRIRAGDVSTPWWFPSETTGGAMDAARLALPIPPGVAWNDPMPVVLPESKDEGEGKRLSIAKAPRGKEAPTAKGPAPKAAVAKARALPGWKFVQVSPSPSPPEPVSDAEPANAKAKLRAAAKKNDPKLAAAARELRDRWLEEVNAGRYLLEARGKYSLFPVLRGEGRGEGRPRELTQTLALLPAAA